MFTLKFKNVYYIF